MISLTWEYEIWNIKNDIEKYLSGLECQKIKRWQENHIIIFEDKSVVFFETTRDAECGNIERLGWWIKLRNSGYNDDLK